MHLQFLNVSIKCKYMNTKLFFYSLRPDSFVRIRGLSIYILLFPPYKMYGMEPAKNPLGIFPKNSATRVSNTEKGKDTRNWQIKVIIVFTYINESVDFVTFRKNKNR